MFLNGDWLLSCKAKNIKDVKIKIPGDVHSALLNASLIPDPYFDCNENVSNWIHYQTWEIKNTFDIDEELDSKTSAYKKINLTLDFVDTFSIIYINEKEVLRTSNMFKHYSVDIMSALKNGKNTIKFVFNPAVVIAEQLSKSLQNPVPWSEGNNQHPHMNLIRKPQFQSGWDWGPCLVPVGIYGDVKIEYIQATRILGFKHYSTSKDISLEIHAESFTENQKLHVSIENLYETDIDLELGSHVYTINHEFTEIKPKLWSTWDYGRPNLYTLKISTDEAQITKEIGFRDLKLESLPDQYGKSFKFILNGQEIYCRGANIIPIDSIPQRETKERYEQILLDAKFANMNMVRIWGGGYYLPDYFYELCDRYGILVWQDLMFACAQYPTADWFLQEVESEIFDTFLRIQYHPSIALWCGDNEVWTTINWQDIAKDNKEFYHSEYKKLNQFLKAHVNENDKSRTFWLASPSAGNEDYDGDFVNISQGDSHYWEVWHGKKNISGYLEVKPRFCSEFGFQSYPSLATVKTFAPEGTNSIHAKAFEVHQKSKCGNKKIQEMIDLYFKHSISFPDLLYLSQVTQAIAIKTAVEFWRLQTGINSGALFWQLNDCWPISSWSSIEYNGRWKQLMYHAKRFFEPVSIILTQDTSNYLLYVVNDLKETVNVRYHVRWFDFHGMLLYGRTDNAVTNPKNKTIVWSLPRYTHPYKGPDGFFYASVEINGKIQENFLFIEKFKNCKIEKPEIKYEVNNSDGQYQIKLTTNVPAFFVHLESDKVRKFSDSSFILLPEEEKVVTCEGDPGNITIYHLN
ncbi:Glycosyl hydrolases family 2, sugar binding domain containing protein [Trichomonas vaginalis G3]|uniref:Beta-mannosidase B n=1 Tax=Trichomonas vaginalis (strain ATCC PRA-98 / G3) TaxID=412133 RepID=A2EA20_TRIV3|nr:glycosyl hydrolase [Trichomonas vaginalis G3]EAY10466.1 Glycosyl hydrolases family 2, sugar binding domain containing protein [Trichomonas vaginalis G3]KAI5489306.1 beta-mannosidase family [Trichomonas vaginalis G3]|eukprot:XP_001322689.1 glycosyl hydrolase [Trichomonas vaginalis G3]